MSATPDLSDAAFDILRVAVDLARTEQIRTVAALKSRLLRTFPDLEAEVTQALAFWARYEYEKRH